MASEQLGVDAAPIGFAAGKALILGKFMAITEIGKALAAGTLRRALMRPAALSAGGTDKSPVAE